MSQDESVVVATGRKPLKTTKEIAKQIGVSEATLRDWRCQRKGPPFIRLTSQVVRYEQAAVDAWIASGTQNTTAA